MKGIFTISFLLITALGLGQKAVFSPKNTVVKFPKVQEGKILNYIFEFTNTGQISLEFYAYEVECSCTAVTLPKVPIAPGQQGRIEVSFDTNGKYYFQDRIINLETNTKRKHEKLRIKVYVEPKPITEPTPEKGN